MKRLRMGTSFWGMGVLSFAGFVFPAFGVSPERPDAQERCLSSEGQVLQVISKAAAGKLTEAQQQRLSQLLVSEGEAAGIDPLFLAAFIQEESGFRLRAASRKGAFGLMQVRPRTASAVALGLVPFFRPAMLFSLDVNVRIGVAYFSKLLLRYQGNYRFAMTAYNAGPGRVSTLIRAQGRLLPENAVLFQRVQKTYTDYRRSLVTSEVISCASEGI
jgi:soluble lytic murein transglycosylase-like protein